VFASADGLYVYDVDSDVVTALERTTSGVISMPRFRGPSVVSFVRQRQPADDQHVFGQDSIYEFDIARKRAQESIRVPGRVVALDWHPDATQLAYLVELGDQSENLLCTFDGRTGATRLIRSFSYTVGRGVNQWDEVSVAWAPNGTAMLVVHTTTEEPSIHLVDIDGADLAPPQTGTFARWVDTRTVVFLQADRQATLRPWHWMSLSTTTGQEHDFALPDAAFRPAISPDGAWIAFDDGAEHPSVYVFDVKSGSTRKLARDHVGPVWLGSREIGATAAGPCPSSDFCVMPWAASKGTIGIDPRSGDQRPLALTTTLQVLVMSGVIDVLGPAA
jgi:Tol biopolymer transport system component